MTASGRWSTPMTTVFYDVIRLESVRGSDVNKMFLTVLALVLTKTETVGVKTKTKAKTF